MGRQYDLIYLHAGALGWMIEDLKSDLNSIAANGTIFFKSCIALCEWLHEYKCQYLLPQYKHDLYTDHCKSLDTKIA